MNEFKPVPLDDSSPMLGADGEPEAPIEPVKHGGRVTTEMLSDSTCRWPLGDPASRDFHYCGEQPQRGGVYCNTHDAMSRPASQRTK